MSGPTVDVDFRKWVTRPHWQFAMYLLREDSWGTWLWSPPGSTARRGTDAATTFNHVNVKLISPGDWWTAIWNSGERFDLYVDIITPAAWNRDRVTMIDLDLDVVRLAGGRVVVADEDEFAAHQLAYSYPQAVIEKTRRVAADVQRRISAGEEPFTTVGADRMREAAKLAAELTAHRPSPGCRP